jgi:hypothetical protein
LSAFQPRPTVRGRPPDDKWIIRSVWEDYPSENAYRTLGWFDSGNRCNDYLSVYRSAPSSLYRTAVVPWMNALDHIVASWMN